MSSISATFRADGAITNVPTLFEPFSGSLQIPRTQLEHAPAVAPQSAEGILVPYPRVFWIVQEC